MSRSIVGGCAAPIPQLLIGATRADVLPGAVRQQWHDHEGRLIASGGRQAGRWWMHWDGLATFWFGEAGDVLAQPTRTGVSAAVRDVFARGVVPVVMLARGYEALHASAVLHHERVIAFCATSGTGKSTLALALAARGLPHFADDTIVYQPATQPPTARALPSAPRVDSSAQVAVSASAGSAELQVRSVDAAPLFCVYILVRDPAVDPGAPRFSAVPPEHRFERLLAHAHPFDMGSPNRRRAFFEHLLSLARQVPVWECRFRPTLDALPAFATAVERHASAA